jgi:hypothetical protein
MLFLNTSILTLHPAQDDRGNQHSSHASLQQYQGAQRPATSMSASRPRRITHEEKVEQEKQMQYQMELEQAGEVLSANTDHRIDR